MQRKKGLPIVLPQIEGRDSSFSNTDSTEGENAGGVAFHPPFCDHNCRPIQLGGKK